MSKLVFRIEKLRHTSKSSFEKQIRWTNIGRRLFWIGIQKFLFVGVVLFSVEFAESYIVQKFEITYWPNQEIAGNYNSQLEFYAVLLTAIFSIYFATIGIILSTGYAKLNRDIIALLIGEQVSSIYTDTLVFATSFCLAATALNIFDYQTGFLTYVLTTLLTIMSVLILFPMGQRLFRFFELSPLIEDEILPKIAHNIDSVAKIGNSISLQNHFSLQARNRLKQLFYIDDRLQIEMSKLEQNLPILTNQHSALLLYYLDRKHLIPEDSYWYPRRQIHKDWFLAGDTATTMALNTGSQIPPEEKTDLDWLETKLLTRIHNHFEKALKAKNWDLALTLLSDMSPRTLRYAQGLFFSIGLEDIKTARKLLEKYLPEATADDSETKMNVMALADTWASITHNFFLETLRRIQTFDKELSVFFDKDDWSVQTSKNLPSFLQLKIGYLQDRIEFEQKIEGHRLSQPRYLQQLTVKMILEYYSEVVQTVANYEKDEFIGFANKMVEIGHPAAATQVVLSTLHSNWKLPGWFADLDSLFQNYLEYEKYDDKEYQLPKIDVEKFQSNFEKQREQLIAMLSNKKLGTHLFDFETRNSNMPDHFGQTYFVLANECFYALDENDEKKLSNVFPTFFSLAFMAANVKFVDPNLDVNQEFRLLLISTANKDIATILGYAILYSEYHGNQELENMPMSIWEEMVGRTENRKEYLENVLRVSDTNNFSWSASPRDIIRTEWKMKFEARFRDDGFGDRYTSYDSKSHPSDIVEEFRGTYYDASDVFFALKVLDEIELPEDQISHSIINYQSQLARKQGDGK